MLYMENGSRQTTDAGSAVCRLNIHGKAERGTERETVDNEVHLIP